MTDVLALALVCANGDLIDTATTPFRLSTGQVLFGPPPIDAPVIEAAGLLAGSLDGSARWLGRALRVRILLDTGSPQELLEAIERLSAAVAPVVPGTIRGRNCQLIITRPDGEQRAISARYTGGLDGLAIETGVDETLQVDLIFRAADPHWSSLALSDASVSFPITGTGVAATLFNATIGFNQAGQPFSGFTSTAAQGTTLVVLNNQGDAEAWPTFEITGAATSIEVMSRTSGQQWRWTGTLASGAVLAVVTDDRAPSVRVGAANSYGGIAAGSRLFPLVGGPNEVAVSVAGADTNTRMAITWTPRRLTS